MGRTWFRWWEMMVLTGTAVLGLSEICRAQVGVGTAARFGAGAGVYHAVNPVLPPYGGYSHQNYGITPHGPTDYGSPPSPANHDSYGYGYYPSYYFFPSYDYPHWESSNYGTARAYVEQGYSPPKGDRPASITVKVPANAEVWFEGRKTTNKGPVREFQSPPLAPGRYVYQVKARWQENGHEVTQMQQVGFFPGEHAQVSFPLPAGG